MLSLSLSTLLPGTAFAVNSPPQSDADCAVDEYFKAEVFGTQPSPAQCVKRLQYPRKATDCTFVPGWQYVPQSGVTSITPAHCVNTNPEPQSQADCTNLQRFVSGRPAGSLPATRNTCVNKVDSPLTAADCPAGYTFTDAVISTTTTPAKCTKDPAGGADTQTDPNLDCHMEPNPLTWILCPVIKLMNKAINGMDNLINTLLTVNQDAIFETDCVKNPKGCGSAKAYYNAWQTFRGFALAVLLVAGLFMVIAQALGFEILDAYTVKKILPRLIFAVIGILLSWELMHFFVGLTNDLGGGIRHIIYYPFTKAGGFNATQQLDSGGEFLLNMLGGGAIIALGFAGLFSFILTAALAVLVAFLVLMVRQLVIVVLILFAPVAIACFILPNTQSIYKLWSESFTKAMLMFPIIVAFIAVGRVFSITAIAGDISGIKPVSEIMGLAAYILPYFLIPKTFSLAGGAMRTLGGAINDKNKGGFDRLKKYRGGKIAKNAANMKNFSRVSENTKLGKGVNNVLGAAFNPSSMLRGKSGVRSRRTARQAVSGANAVKENEVYQANGQDDNFLLAVANKGLATQKYTSSQAKYAATQQQLSSASTVEEREKAQKASSSALAEVNARKGGLDAAAQLPMEMRNTRAVKMTALKDLSRTGYQFDDGAEGYAQLSSSVRNITGNDQTAYAAAMDSTQFGLKSAGRFDLGGINHGAGYDFETGINKSSGYTAGNAKLQTFTAGMQNYLNTNGKTVDPATGATRAMSTPELSQEIARNWQSGRISSTKISEWHAKLLDSEQGAVGGNKIEIIRQRSAIENLYSQVSASPQPYQFPGSTELVEGVGNNLRRSRMQMDPALLNENT